MKINKKQAKVLRLELERQSQLVAEMREYIYEQDEEISNLKDDITTKNYQLTRQAAELMRLAGELEDLKRLHKKKQG